uniref:dimethyl sulfoxide reductase anchor subunit family protein n=1 Tax=Pararhizobium sp. IMCC3301 TaxID=3067904 RepID=UPI002740A3F8|nr:DmsC/YnfH family molybdoenzyme membrane anchor subunit [Pararhizobium sp. IMCC3301]
MHPALSVIIFTTLSGFGYGLAAMLGLLQPDPALAAVKIGHVLAFVAIAGGLVSSTLHLGNPQRAWRAFSQWRSSWLSREGVLAVLTFVPLTAQTGFAVLFDLSFGWLGFLVAVMAAITVYATSMIYASLKTVHAWHNPVTNTCYLLFALSGGLLALATLNAFNGLEASLIVLTIVALAAAFMAKTAWYRALDQESGPSTPESATGLGFLGKARLLEPPHMGENYLTREMGFKVARKHAQKLRLLSYVLGLILPVLLLLIMAASGMVFFGLAALISHLAGVLTERWLFFAEAKHAVSVYYGADRA